MAPSWRWRGCNRRPRFRDDFFSLDHGIPSSGSGIRRACGLLGSPAVCRKPPVGMGTACTSNDQCAGTEATFCDSVVTHACAVQGCSLSPDDCYPGYLCCDLSKYGMPITLCSYGSCQ